MSAERFTVVSTTGYEIKPDSLSGTTSRAAPKVWGVLDTAVCHALVAEWSPTGNSAAYCQEQAEKLAELLNAERWDEAAVMLNPIVTSRRQGLCKACHGPLDGITEGCRRCKHRHYKRKLAL